MLCLVCSGELLHFANGQVLGDQEVEYRKCSRCGLVAAVNPTWLDRSYSQAITKLDIGLLNRSMLMSNITAAVLRSERLRTGPFLDWAGGYGTLTRLMRDRGYDFRHADPMAENIFSRGFEGDPRVERFSMVTAIEVLEHLPDPVEDLAPAAASTDLLLATTQLLPSPTPQPDDWWYYAPETGQHITFYTAESIRALAERLGFPSVVTGSFVHLFHRGQISRKTSALIRNPKVAYALGGASALLDRRHSLIASDLERAAAT
jgi:hypothetical protein